MTPLRILHVVANRWWTGSADPALALASALARRGHAVWFACIRGDVLELRARAAGLAPLESLTLERTSRPWALARDVLALRRAMGRERLDLVHTHLSHDHWLARLAVAGTEVRLVRTVHHRRTLHANPATRWLFHRTDAMIAVSEGIARRARDVGVPDQRLTVVPGAVDTSRFAPRGDRALMRRELGLGTGPVVGCVARMVAGRGHGLLLEATRRLRSGLPDLRLLLVGRGEGERALAERVRTLGLENVVVFAGYHGEDLPRVLGAMDCFVLLGSGSEETCRAVLEAMATGLPVIGARVGALPETIVDGLTGWLVDGDAGLVAERLARVLSNPDAARAMGGEGRRRVEQQFVPERQAREVERVYARLFGSPRPAW